MYLPVIADTWDADLSDYLAFPLKESHVFDALDNAKSGPVVEGNVGGGTGMTCKDASAQQHEDGSILVIVGTNAPVSALTLKAMTKRAVLGLARNGATANPGSGDVVLAFATTPVDWDRKLPYLAHKGETLFEYNVEALYTATVRVTEEAVINALVGEDDDGFVRHKGERHSS